MDNAPLELWVIVTLAGESIWILCFICMLLSAILIYILVTIPTTIDLQYIDPINLSVKT